VAGLGKNQTEVPQVSPSPYPPSFQLFHDEDKNIMNIKNDGKRNDDKRRR